MRWLVSKGPCHQFWCPEFTLLFERTTDQSCHPNAVLSMALAHMHIYPCTHIRTYTFIHIHTHPYTCTNTHTYIHTHIHTYIHTYTNVNAVIIWKRIYTGANKLAQLVKALAAKSEDLILSLDSSQLSQAVLWPPLMCYCTPPPPK